MAEALLSLTQHETLLGRARPLPEHKRAQAEAVIAAVSAEVRRIAEGELDDVDHTSTSAAAAEVRLIVHAMVLRGTTNPRGLSSERIGDWQGQGMRPVYATDEEMSAIRAAVGLKDIRSVPLAGDMPQRLLDEAAAAPYRLHLGD
ncbi:hypothetical protein [Streptomonospora litoralis]|uniref:Uncharacterized protein n=1 Tax=Streptomonospora litoralis TaxID=2498135 RepID=A0A4P6Q7V3_9ACTN|nr:hypothetical protein [Streptomonospora litoralis]QBI56803.1 hypothetical protein EKD16_25310 [Streptomonospora litoralis]